MSAHLNAAGYEIVGIDHFANPGDGLARAARDKRLRRNFQGYTDDACTSLIGLGASSISSFPRGYAQNASPRTYLAALREGRLPTARGHGHSLEDRLRARAIEILICDFFLDLSELEAIFGDAADLLRTTCREAAIEFAPHVTFDGFRLTIGARGRPLTRLVARMFDSYRNTGARYSQVS